MFTYRPHGSLREIFIGEALDSLRKQTDVNIQAIILDDGSPSQIMPKYVMNTPNIEFTYIHCPKNQGKHKMMDIGLPMLKAPVCTTLHDDDYYPNPDSLLKRLNFFNEEPDTAMIFTNATYIQMSGKKVMTSKPLYSETMTINHTHQALLNHNYLCGASYAVRTDLKKSFRAHPSLKHGEEYDIWCQISKYSRDNGLSIRYSPEITAVYRMHSEQTWNAVRNLSKNEKDRQYLNFIRNRSR